MSSPGGMIDDESEPIIRVADLPRGFHRFSRLRLHLNRPVKVDRSIGASCCGVCSDHGASVRQSHFTKVFDLAGFQIVVREMGYYHARASGIIELTTGGAIVKLAILPKGQAERCIRYIPVVSPIGDAEWSQTANLSIFSRGWIKREESCGALLDAIYLLGLLVPDGHPPRSFGLGVIPAERDAFLPNRQPD